MAEIVLPPGEKGQFAVLPEGVYKMQIQTPKMAYARGSGAPTVECYLAVLEGQYTGERVYHQYSLQAEALWRVRDDLRTTGRLPRDRFPVDQPTKMDDSEVVKLLEGASGYAAIFTDTFRGAPRSKLATEGFLTPEELTQRGITPTAAPPPQRPTAYPPQQAGVSAPQYPEAPPF